VAWPVRGNHGVIVGIWKRGRQITSFARSLRSVCACHVDNPIVVSTRHADAPWIAADLAVLNEAAMDVRLDVDFHLLAAKRTGDQELIGHLRQSYCNAVGQ
jgi:hypothetical protein